MSSLFIEKNSLTVRQNYKGNEIERTYTKIGFMSKKMGAYGVYWLFGIKTGNLNYYGKAEYINFLMAENTKKAKKDKKASDFYIKKDNEFVGGCYHTPDAHLRGFITIEGVRHSVVLTQYFGGDYVVWIDKVPQQVSELYMKRTEEYENVNKVRKVEKSNADVLPLDEDDDDDVPF